MQGPLEIRPAIIRHGAVGKGRIVLPGVAPDAFRCEAGVLSVAVARGRVAEVVRAERVWAFHHARTREVDQFLEVHFAHHNAFVRSGLRNLELLQAGLGGSKAAYIGLDNDNTAVTFDTRFLHGSSAGTATAATATATQLFAAVTAVVVADGTGVVQSTTYTAPTLNASNFSAGVFKIFKEGLMLAATDASGNLVDVIGGSGGAAPYDRTLALDFTGATGFSYTPAMQTYSIADPTQ